MSDAAWGAVTGWTGGFTARQDINVGPPQVGAEFTFNVSGTFTLTRSKVSSQPGQLPSWDGTGRVTGSHSKKSRGIPTDTDGTWSIDEECTVSLQIDPGPEGN